MILLLQEKSIEWVFNIPKQYIAKLESLLPDDNLLASISPHHQESI